MAQDQSLPPSASCACANATWLWSGSQRIVIAVLDFRVLMALVQWCMVYVFYFFGMVFCQNPVKINHTNRVVARAPGLPQRRNFSGRPVLA